MIRRFTTQKSTVVTRLHRVDAVNNSRCIRRSRHVVSRRFAYRYLGFPQVIPEFVAGSIPGSSTIKHLVRAAEMPMTRLISVLAVRFWPLRNPRRLQDRACPTQLSVLLTQASELNRCSGGLTGGPRGNREQAPPPMPTKYAADVDPVASVDDRRRHMAVLAATIKSCRLCPGLNIAAKTESAPGYGSVNSP